MIGTKVSHYTILERIGAGGMGEVYKALDSRLDRTIALKLLNPSAVADEGKRQRFMQEARIASGLNHPSILTIHEIGQEQNRYFIATEFIEGQTAREKLRSGPMPAQAVIEIAIQIVKALSVAHSAGIIHRDIKPENIMIRPDGYVKVLDFGLAKLMETTGPTSQLAGGARRRGQILKTEGNVVLGTVRYMSPEQVQHLPIDHRVDIFSLGVLLYEMLTGELPFGGQQTIDIAYEIIGADPPPLSAKISGASLKFQPIINRCLEKNPDARYQDAQSLLKELRQLHRQIELTENLAGELAKESDSSRLISSPARRPSIVVIYFENLTADPELEWQRRAIMELLTARLMSNSYLDVVSSEQVADILEQLGFSAGSEIDKVTSAAVARRAGVGCYLIGSFMPLAGNITISAHLHDVGSGQPISSISARRGRIDELFSLIDEIAGRVERELQATREDIESAQVANLVTDSLPALRAYQAGLDDFRRADFRAAEPQFRQAITLDARFTLAYYYLARIERGRQEITDHQHLDAALEWSGRVSERERLLILLEKAALERDYIRQMRLADELVAQYPREKLGYLFLGEAYHWRGECDRAFIIFQQALSFDAKLIFQGAQAGAGIGHIFECYLDTGNIERAEQLAREQVAAFPQNWLAHQLLGIALYYRRRYQEAELAFAQAATLNQSGLRHPQLWQARIRIQMRDFDAAERQLSLLAEESEGKERARYWRELAETLRERGRLRAWIKLLTSEPDRFNNQTYCDAAFAPIFWRAFFFEQVGELQRAFSEYEMILRRLDNVSNKSSELIIAVWARLHVGRLLAIMGEYERAAELAEQIKLIGRNMPNPQFERLALYLWGAIEFYQGNYQLASEMLERSISSYYNGFALAITMLAQCMRQLKKFDRAVELLDCLQPYGASNGGSRFYSCAQLDLEKAKIYEAARDLERAREYYQNCLNVWADANNDFIGKLEAEAGLQIGARAEREEKGSGVGGQGSGKIED